MVNGLGKANYALSDDRFSWMSRGQQAGAAVEADGVQRVFVW